MDISALILESSSTKSEALVRLHALESSVMAALFGGQYQLDAAEEIYSDWVKEVSPKITGARAEVEKAFTAAEKAIRDIEPVVLFLPFALPAETISAISQKIKSLLDIKIDPSLLAGCAISYRGQYKDYSVKAKLQEKHEQIIKLCLKSVT